MLRERSGAGTWEKAADLAGSDRPEQCEQAKGCAYEYSSVLPLKQHAGLSHQLSSFVWEKKVAGGRSLSLRVYL